MIEEVLLDISKGSADLYSGLTPQAQQLLVRILDEMRDEGHSISYDHLWDEDFIARPVGIKQFIEDPYYLGEICNPRHDPATPAHERAGLFPSWRRHLMQIFNPESNYWEVVFTGCIGGGKTFAAVLALLYKIYFMSCLINPQKFYHLAPGSIIAIGLYNIFKYKTETTSFAVMESMLERSPYFQNVFGRDPNKTTKILFPNNIIVVSGATELHAIGENLHSIMIDEANFMKSGATAEDRGQAYNLHEAVKRRIESRFMHQGSVPGLLALVSSKRDQSDYVEQYINDNKGSDELYVVDMSRWEAHPPGRYSKRYFRVAVGSHNMQSRILKRGEEVPTNIDVVRVPVDFKNSFKKDIESSLRDIAGVATYGLRNLITDRECIFDCVDKDREHPFTTQSPSLDYKSDVQLEESLNVRELFKVVQSKFRPRVNPSVGRHVHVDLAESNDCAAIAVGHLEGFDTVTRYHDDGREYTTVAPRIYIDLMVQIAPPAGSQIDFSKIREFIMALRTYGYVLSQVTYDGFQSTDSIQTLQKQGVNAGKLSVDRTIDPYMMLKQCVLEHRISYYEYVPFLDELLNIQLDDVKKKVDHLDNMPTLAGGVVRGSKDVSDAVAGVVANIMMSGEARPDLESAPVRVASGNVPLPHEGEQVMGSDDWVLSDFKDRDRMTGYFNGR